jgi:hypothetical protein
MAEECELAIEPCGQHYVLSKKDETGAVRELVLSELEVMFLARLAPSVARQISANKAPADSDISALIAVSVTDFRASWDLHRDIVILRLQDRSQMTFDFSFSPVMSRTVGQSLIEWADKLEAAPKPTKQ